MIALRMITAKFDIPTFPYDASLYLKLFKKRLLEKESDGSELWLDDVKTIAKIVTSEIEEIQESMSHSQNFFSIVLVDSIKFKN